MAGVIGPAWRSAAGVDEMVGEAAPAVDLDEQIGEIDDR